MTGGVHFTDARTPDGMRIYAIGDVHGRSDLLRAMHESIDDELAQDRPDDWRIIHVGDYCDRGPDTRGVIDFLLERQRKEPRIITLRGNHDEGFENFLTGRPGFRIFTDNGGEMTALSYGVEADFFSIQAMEESQAALAAAVPGEHLAFLEGLGTSVEFGDFFFCHAGIRPGVPLAAQDVQDLLWIRREFLDDPRLHPKLIVHGHTPVGEVEIRPNRVDVDTMAFHSGRLSALVLEGVEKTLKEVSARPL